MSGFVDLFLSLAYSSNGSVFSCCFQDALHRANNLLITVAEGVEGLFYTSDNTTAAENLCAFHEGELGEWAHIHCSSILQGKFVQVQNHLFEFHLSEVEVYGY